MNKKLFFILSFSLISNLIFAQYYYIPNTNNPGNPGGLNSDPEYPNGSGMAAGWTTILAGNNTVPTWSQIQSIPFNFNFNGVQVNQYKVSSSGVLTFTTSAATTPSYSNSAIPNSTIPDNSIMAWGIQGTGQNDEIVTKNFGNSGNQQHWISFSSYTYGNTWTYWSIVLEEATNKIYIVDQRTSGNVQITAGIQINSSTAFGVSGSPSLASIASTNPDDTDNNYYEFIFGTQPNNDANLTSLNINQYALAPATVSISGSVTNIGGNNINTLDITWSDGTNSYTDNITGLNIATNNSYNFTHSNQLSLPIPGNANISVSVDLVNNMTDPDMSNNTLTTTTSALLSIPEKFVVGEEKTGSWCGWCPRGAVALAEMESNLNFIGIAVHNGDPMVVNAYDDDIGNYIPGGYPGGGVDRVIDGDPGDFAAMHAARVNDVVPCGVNTINATFDPSTNRISVATEIEVVGVMDGNFRLSCVIVEDDLESTGSGWAQSNFYSGGGGSGTMAFPLNINGGYNFSTGPSSVMPADFGGYDHVARSLSSNNILGDPNSLPAGTINPGTYNYSFTDVNIATLAAYNAVGFNWSKAYAVVMIVNASTGEILNAKKTALSNNAAPSWNCDPTNGCIDPGTGTGQYSSLAACNAVCNSTDINDLNSKISVYPNPVKDILTIDGSFNSIEIVDIFGKKVLTSKYVKHIKVSGLANGIYMLNIMTKKGIQSQKITILE